MIKDENMTKKEICINGGIMQLSPDLRNAQTVLKNNTVIFQLMEEI